MSNPAAKQKFKEKKDKIIKEQNAEYTFKPELLYAKKFDYVPATLAGGSGEQFSQNLKKKLKEKQQKIAAERRQKEMSELE